MARAAVPRKTRETTQLSAIGTADSGTIKLTATTSAEMSEWLVYLVRRHLRGDTA